MSAFIPDQLHHMSKKELIEFAQTAHEENVKLNKRVEELEDKEHLTILTTHEATLNSDYGKKWLNKFALEQRCVGVSEFVEKFNVEYGGGFGEALEEYSAIYCEQLHKE